jgi:hypothetical protein
MTDFFSYISPNTLGSRLGKNLDVDSVGVIFLTILFLSLYIHPVVLANLTERIWEEGEESKTSLFISPWSDARRRKEQEERIRKLKGLKQQVEEIIEQCAIYLQDNRYDYLIGHGYHQLDQVFSKLVRSPDITPLEHTRIHFSTKEIDYTTLEMIVQRFYEVRFGGKTQKRSDAIDFIRLLQNLVIVDIFG